MIVKRWFIGILKFIWHHTYIKYRNWHSVEKEKRQWAEKRVRYGKENPDKTFYVIRRREIRAGLFSYFLQNVNDIKYALDRGWIPVVDLQNSLNMANLSASQVAQTATILAALTTTTPAA